MQFFTMGSSKIEVFETCFFDIMTTQYDHPRYVKPVLTRIYVVCTLFIPYFGCVRGCGMGGGVKNVEKNDPSFFWVENHECYGFFDFEPKKCFRSRLYGVCMGRSGTRANAVYALFSHLCYVGGFGDLGDPVVPSLRDVREDVVTIYAY